MPGHVRGQQHLRPRLQVGPVGAGPRQMDRDHADDLQRDAVRPGIGTHRQVTTPGRGSARPCRWRPLPPAAGRGSGTGRGSPPRAARWRGPRRTCGRPAGRSPRRTRSSPRRCRPWSGPPPGAAPGGRTRRGSRGPGRAAGSRPRARSPWPRRSPTRRPPPPARSGRRRAARAAGRCGPAAARTAPAPPARSPVVGLGCTPLKTVTGIPAASSTAVTPATTWRGGQRGVGDDHHGVAAGAADDAGQPAAPAPK